MISGRLRPHICTDCSHKIALIWRIALFNQYGTRTSQILLLTNRSLSGRTHSLPLIQNHIRKTQIQKDDQLKDERQTLDLKQIWNDRGSLTRSHKHTVSLEENFQRQINELAQNSQFEQAVDVAISNLNLQQVTQTLTDLVKSNFDASAHEDDHNVTIPFSGALPAILLALEIGKLSIVSSAILKNLKIGEHLAAEFVSIAKFNAKTRALTIRRKAYRTVVRFYCMFPRNSARYRLQLKDKGSNKDRDLCPDEEEFKFQHFHHSFFELLSKLVSLGSIKEAIRFVLHYEAAFDSHLALKVSKLLSASSFSALENCERTFKLHNQLEKFFRDLRVIDQEFDHSLKLQNCMEKKFLDGSLETNKQRLNPKAELKGNDNHERPDITVSWSETAEMSDSLCISEDSANVKETPTSKAAVAHLSQHLTIIPARRDREPILITLLRTGDWQQQIDKWYKIPQNRNRLQLAHQIRRAAGAVAGTGEIDVLLRLFQCLSRWIIAIDDETSALLLQSAQQTLGTPREQQVLRRYITNPNVYWDDKRKLLVHYIERAGLLEPSQVQLHLRRLFALLHETGMQVHRIDIMYHEAMKVLVNRKLVTDTISFLAYLEEDLAIDVSELSARHTIMSISRVGYFETGLLLIRKYHNKLQPDFFDQYMRLISTLHPEQAPRALQLIRLLAGTLRGTTIADSAIATAFNDELAPSIRLSSISEQVHFVGSDIDIDAALRLLCTGAYVAWLNRRRTEARKMLQQAVAAIDRICQSDASDETISHSAILQVRNDLQALENTMAVAQPTPGSISKHSVAVAGSISAEALNRCSADELHDKTLNIDEAIAAIIRDIDQKICDARKPQPIRLALASDRAQKMI